MTPGPVFLAVGLYLTLLVALVVSLLEERGGKRIWAQTLRRWGKFLLGLAILAIIVQILTFLA